MSDRKPWTEEEDKVLKYLKEEEGMKKWSHIARRMSEEYKMGGRNGKQCRQRYHNHLDETIVKEDWTYEEELALYSLHDEIGNKWAQIAAKMNGRTDNCVKNHFYSKLRKALRKLNKVIHTHFRKEFREVRMTVLYKIIEATDDRFKEKPTITPETSEQSSRLKNMLLSYSHDADNEFEDDLPKLKSLVAAIHKFSHEYKRKPKKCRKGNSEGKHILSSKLPKFDKFKCSSDIEDEDDSNDYIPVSEEESFQLGSVEPTEKRNANKVIKPTPLRTSGSLPIPVINPSAEEHNIYLSNSLNVESILKNHGLLQDGNMLNMSNFLKRSLSIRSESNQSEKDRLEDMNLGDSIDKNFILGYYPKGDVNMDEHKLFQSN